MKTNHCGSLLFLLRRRCFTLIELLIVISILVFVGGVISINISRALTEQRFRTEVDLMVDTLRLAQDMMLIVGADVHLNIKNEEKKKGIEYWLTVADKVPKEWENLISRSKRKLRAIHSVQFFEEGPFPFPSPDEGLDIRFLSEGSMMSKGVLRLSTHEDSFVPGSLNRAVCLRGYPHPLASVPEEKGELATCEEEDEAEFLDRLTQDTVNEVLADIALEEKNKKFNTSYHEEETSESQQAARSAP